MSRITKTELELKVTNLETQIEELQAQLAEQAKEHVSLMAEQAKEHRELANQYAEQRFQAGWTAGALGQKAGKPVPEVYTRPIEERKAAMAWHKALDPKLRSTMTKLPDIYAAWKARA